MTSKPTLLRGCPDCWGNPVPQVLRGTRSRRFSLGGCEHVYQVIDYTKLADTAEEAAARWNLHVENHALNPS